MITNMYYTIIYLIIDKTIKDKKEGYLRWSKLLGNGKGLIDVGVFLAHPNSKVHILTRCELTFAF